MDCPGLSPQRRFTRPQFCRYFDADSKRAHRFVKAIIRRRCGVESEWPVVNGGGEVMRISSKPIYRALGVENIRHRRKAGAPVVMRRLLSLDFVLEHPGLNWLPTRGKRSNLLKARCPFQPHSPRIYYGAVRAQRRYFALKLPVAGGDKTVTFAYVDPGHATAVELNSWERRMDRFGMRSAPRAAGGGNRHRRGTGLGFAGGSTSTSFGRRRSQGRSSRG